MNRALKLHLVTMLSLSEKRVFVVSCTFIVKLRTLEIGAELTCVEILVNLPTIVLRLFRFLFYVCSSLGKSPQKLATNLIGFSV